MKKIKHLSLLLCLTILLQCLAMPAMAAETTQPQIPEETTAPDSRP